MRLQRGGRAGRATLPTGDDVTAGRVVGRRDPRRRVSVSPTTAERAKINAVGRNRVTTAGERVARPYRRVTLQRGGRAGARPSQTSQILLIL